MRSSSHRRRAWLGVAIGVLGLAGSGSRDALSQAASMRSSPSAACSAWHEHVADLLQQHRTAHEMSDEDFAEILRVFYMAQSACTQGKFSEAFTLYGGLPIGRVRGRELR